jgi:hypothetical protein
MTRIKGDVLKEIFMVWDTHVQREADPCLAFYPHRNITEREIHLNLSLHSVRVYIRSGARVYTFGPTVEGPVTTEMARNSDWCHIHSVVSKINQTGKGLLNFVVFCQRREIGFHSDLWIRNGQHVKIPGAESSGCIRIPHADSRSFYDLVKEGDGVRIYAQNFWRPPLFAYGQPSAHCI